MYHNLVFGRTGNEYNRDIYNFEQDLKFLARNFSVIDFDDLVAIRDGRMTLSSDAVVITFDDGDLSMYALAYPLLREYSMKASFFIITDVVGTVGYMNWNQIEELARYRTKEGISLFTIGSHSASHPPLATVDAAALLRELQVSRTVLESHTGQRVDYLALPFGSGAGKPEIIAAARASGYKGIRTSHIAFTTPGTLDLWQLPGLSVDNSSSDVVSAGIWSLLGY
ncbi:MAG: polysaccharide deacetylase family protein [Clostridia bacterium]|nr:polysaccharide deacetylase family protein [Spirochaetia bacterium]